MSVAVPAVIVAFLLLAAALLQERAHQTRRHYHPERKRERLEAEEQLAWPLVSVASLAVTVGATCTHTLRQRDAAAPHGPVVVFSFSFSPLLCRAHLALSSNLDRARNQLATLRLTRTVGRHLLSWKAQGLT